MSNPIPEVSSQTYRSDPEEETCFEVQKIQFLRRRISLISIAFQCGLKLTQSFELLTYQQESDRLQREESPRFGGSLSRIWPSANVKLGR